MGKGSKVERKRRLCILGTAIQPHVLLSIQHLTNSLCVFQAFDAFIYIFFALEMVVKMVALGIFGRRCYLGDTWNRLDFFIVMAG